MEKNSDILFLGDRRAGEIAPILEEKFAGRYDPARYHIRCRQLVDEQSTAALAEAAKPRLPARRPPSSPRGWAIWPGASRRRNMRAPCARSARWPKTPEPWACC